MEQTVELVVRKKEVKFVEKLFRYLGYDFKHDAFKRIIYNEASYDTPVEEKMKAYYDGYCFLLKNYKNPLTEGLLKKFIYILKGKEADDDLVTRIATAFFDICSHRTIDEAIEFHLKAYQEIVEYDEEDKLIITLMLLNYALLKAGIPSLAFLETDLRKYKPLRDEYFNKGNKEIYSFLFEIIKKAKTQDKEYYPNLKSLDGKMIYHKIKEDEEMLKDEYGIDHIFLFGSFSKGDIRIDSDIDFLVVLKEEAFFEDYWSKIEVLAKHYYIEFKRFVDFSVTGKYVDDAVIKEMKTAKKIF